MRSPAAKLVSQDEALERAQRGTRQFLLARVCVIALGYVATAILTRKLGPTAYGIYGVILSQLVWMELLNNAGVAGAIAKLMADGRYDPGAIERSGRALLVGLSVLLFGVCWLLAPQMASFMRIPGGEVLFRIAIIDLPFMAAFTSYDGILNGRRQFGILAGAHLLYGVSKFAGVVGLIGLGLSVERVLITNVLSTCVVCAVLATRYWPRGFRPQGSIMAEIAVLTAPIALYLISNQVLTNLDLWSLKVLWNGEGKVVGQYVASLNLAKTLMVIPGAQAGVLFTSVARAVVARDAAGARRHIHEASRFAVVIGTAAWVILGLDASEVLGLFFSSAYADGERFLRLQLAGFALFALLDAFSHALMAAGRQWAVAAALVAMVPLVWLSNYMLIPWLGPLGAATSMLLGTALGAVVTGTMAYHCFGSLVQSCTLTRVFIAAAVIASISLALQVDGPLVLVKVALLGGLYLFVLYLLGEISGKDFGFSRKSPAGSSI
jgi:O-antigen/teichoic acid export membrane protein